MKFLPLRFFPDNINIDFIKFSKLFLVVTLLLTIGTFGLLFFKGLNLGIDFSGGILIEAEFEQKADLAKMREVIGDLDLGDVSLQNFGNDKVVMIRVGAEGDIRDGTMHSVNKVKQALASNFQGKINYRKVDFVGPQVGGELIQDGIIAVILSFICIAVYLWARFEWQYGVGAVISLIHDAVITVGFYCITGLEFNLTSIAAILTIVGYSVNDSVVIYDRIRENKRKYRKMPDSELYNLSINETLSRTILTVTTTLIANLALILFGGEVVASFSAAMFFGIIVGTYSSIYVSVPILLYIGNNKNTKEVLVDAK
jgi:preprotein translocase subunit SecF